MAVTLLIVLYGAIMKVAAQQRAKDQKQMNAQSSYANNQDQLNGSANASRSVSAPSDSDAPQGEKAKDSKANRKVIYGYMFIVGTFVVTYIYAYVMFTLRSKLDYCEMGYERTSLYYVFLLASVTLQSFNAVCNPIVYSYCLTHFRQAFRKNIIQIFTCGRRSGEERKERSNFMLDVPDDRKASQFTKKSVTAAILSSNTGRKDTTISDLNKSFC